jgi:hypothetical protein
MSEPVFEIKLTAHEDRGKWVVNTPGTHVQRQPRVYGSREAALARVTELVEMGGVLA